MRAQRGAEDGNLADNPPLYDVLVEQAQLERRIATLEAQVAAAQIAVPSASGVAEIGTSVRVRDIASGEIAEYELVGEVESDAGNGRVSIAAPVGRALAGRNAGDRVEVETPRKTVSLEILAVWPLVGAELAQRAAA